MSCEQTTRLLSQYIDDVLSLPVRVEIDHHLDSCPVCRAELVELRSLSRSLAQLARPVEPANLASTINDALMIEAAAMRQVPEPTFGARLSRWLEPRLMPYSVGSLASLVLFVSMFVALRPHFIALREAALTNNRILALDSGYDLTQPVTPKDYSATRAPFAAQSPSLDPGGALAALTSSYAQPRSDVTQEGDDMIVVADVFSNGAASLADVVQAPRDRQMLADFEVALRQSAAFVPASLDRRPDTMRVVFTVQKVDVRDRSF
ncbi:MAG TPA: zf-HC2 domain-containing protein [Pyrinomonadaceae bacterium]|nr:zf-HC2 domain-containing protein [Pyrinomonadaceae bacterium]